MSKRREAFLNKNPMLKSFTKNSIVSNFNISSEEFDSLVESGFLILSEKKLCEDCLRTWDETVDECKYCNCDDYYVDKSYYTYS